MSETNESSNPEEMSTTEMVTNKLQEQNQNLTDDTMVRSPLMISMLEGSHQWKAEFDVNNHFVNNLFNGNTYLAALNQTLKNENIEIIVEMINALISDLTNCAVKSNIIKEVTYKEWLEISRAFLEKADLEARQNVAKKLEENKKQSFGDTLKKLMEIQGLIEIFKMDGDKVLPSIDCYTEPYLKRVMDKYKDPIPALCYLHYMSYPYSQYNNLPDSEKEKSILSTYPGEYSPNDVEIIEALRILTERYESPITNFFKSQKHTMELLTKFHLNLNVNMLDADEKSGNYNPVKKTLLDSSKLAQAYLDLEKKYKEEIKTRLRGGMEGSYDDNFKD